jgi:acid phosphatase
MSIVFYTIGDWGKKTNSLLNVANSMDNMSNNSQYKPNFILSLGDNFYPNGVESSDDPKWKEIYSNIFTGKNLFCPWYSILGNHDYGINPQAQIDYYIEKKDKRWVMPSRYYYVTHTFANKKVVIICLDTIELDLITSAGFVNNSVLEENKINNKSSREQVNWLEKILSNCDADWLIVTGHYSMYTSGYHMSNNNLINLLKPLFIKYKVDIYISGHCHDLEHLQDNGINYIVSGAGSKSGNVSTIFQTKFAYGNCGYTIHKISENKMTILFINEKSKILYSFDMTQKRNI